MMKKIVNILLSLFYLLLVSGITVSIHYCQGNIEDINVMSQAASCCCGDEEMPDNCCSNQNLIIQFDSDEQLVSQIGFSFERYQYMETEKEMFNDESLATAKKSELYIYKDLPPPENQKIWILNSTFTFYG